MFSCLLAVSYSHKFSLFFTLLPLILAARSYLDETKILKTAKSLQIDDIYSLLNITVSLANLKKHVIVVRLATFSESCGTMECGQEEVGRRDHGLLQETTDEEQADRIEETGHGSPEDERHAGRVKERQHWKNNKRYRIPLYSTLRCPLLVRLSTS